MEAKLIYSIDYERCINNIILFSKKFAKRYPQLKFRYNKIDYPIFHNHIFNLDNIKGKDIIKKEIEIFISWNILPDISYMFFKTDLKFFNEIKFDTKYVFNMSHLFHHCHSLLAINFSSEWDTKNVINMSFMFTGCFLLKTIPDISKWNTVNVSYMKSTFSSLKTEKLPDISKWNLKNCIDISGMFSYSSLTQLPDISKWDTKNIKYMGYLFNYCEKLLNLPNISIWDTSNVKNMCRMFYECSGLLSVPDISKWDTKNVENMCSMFSGCSSISKLFAINKWNLHNLIDMSSMFKNCISLTSIPKINLVKAADTTKFVEGCISLNSSEIILANIKNINNEEINMLDNNFYLLTEPNRKEIFKIIYEKILLFTSDSSTAYKCAWLARNNDCFVIDYFKKKLKKIDIKESIIYRYLNFLKTNKYNIDEDSLWNAGFTLKKSQKEISDSDYEYISDDNSDDNSSENYTKEIEVY